MIDWLIHAVWAAPALAQTAQAAAQSIPDAVNQLSIDFVRGCLDLKSTAEQCVQLGHLPDPSALIDHCKSVGMDAGQCLAASQAQTGPAVTTAASAAPVATAAAAPAVATAPVVPMVVSPPAAPVSPSSSASTLSLVIGPVVEWLLSLAAAVVTAGVPIALTWARQHLKLMQDAVLAEQIAGAATRGAGLASEYLQTAATNDRDLTIDVKRSAVSAGVQYVLKSFPDAIAKLGASPDHIASMVIGELGKQTASALPIEQIAPVDPPAPPSAAPSPGPASDWPVAPTTA
jgi:hypothetical protein